MELLKTMDAFRKVQSEINEQKKITNHGRIICISTKLVLASFYKEVFKEFTLEIPDSDLEDCSYVECTALPGTERIIRKELTLISEPCLYKCYVAIGQEYAFNIHCLSGEKSFTREVIFTLQCTISLPDQGPFDVEARIYPSTCRSFILPDGAYIQRFVGEQVREQFAFTVEYDYQQSSIYVGAPSHVLPGKQDAGSVSAYSSLTGEKIFSKHLSEAEDELGFSLSAGEDLNGDGWRDILVGAPSARIGGSLRAGYIRVLSGLDGSILLEIQNTVMEDQFGWSVSWAGDVDGDGKPDILVGAPQASPLAAINAGSVFVISGQSGSILYRLDGQNPGDSFGYAVAKIGDVDGDGVPDFAVGAPFASPSGLQQAGIVYVFSGASGSLLYSIEGGEENAGLGFSLSALSDINGDGIPEILVGAPDSSPGGRDEAGSVYIFSGLDGSQLLHFPGPIEGEEVGISVSAVDDLDNDGLPELLLGAPSASPNDIKFSGKAYLVSSQTGEILYSLNGVNVWEQFGWSVFGNGNLNSKKIFVGAPGIDTLYVFNISPIKMYSEINATIVISIMKNADILIPAFEFN